eukprot:1071474-Prorocentrum_minimum.AAC.2
MTFHRPQTGHRGYDNNPAHRLIQSSDYFLLNMFVINRTLAWLDVVPGGGPQAGEGGGVHPPAPRGRPRALEHARPVWQRRPRAALHAPIGARDHARRDQGGVEEAAHEDHVRGGRRPGGRHLLPGAAAGV